MLHFKLLLNLNFATRTKVIHICVRSSIVISIRNFIFYDGSSFHKSRCELMIFWSLEFCLDLMIYFFFGLAWVPGPEIPNSGNTRTRSTRFWGRLCFSVPGLGNTYPAPNRPIIIPNQPLFSFSKQILFFFL